VKPRPYVTLAIEMPDGDPPSEFRIFRAGKNETTKGTFVFDEVSAKAVMAEYLRHGIDVMIDLEHLSLDGESRNFDPDARGWACLEMRNGELWAVGVKWAPDGSARLAEKRQRYISPAFKTDPKTRRITRLLNIALTALPATHDLTPLIAAREEGATVLLNAILTALGLAEGTSEEDALKALSAKLSATPPPFPPKKEGEEEGEKPAALADREAIEAVTKEMRESIAKLNAAEQRREVDAVLLDARTTKHVSPAFEKLARTKSADEVRELVAVLPPAGRGEFHAPAKEKDAPETIELSAAERHVCRLTDVNPDEVLAHKKTLAARAAAEVI
jgi:phage I-like protein